MCCHEFIEIWEKPYNFLLPKLQIPMQGICQQEFYIVNGDLDRKFCFECIGDNYNDDEPYYTVYYHGSAIGYVPQNIEWFHCNVIVTLCRPITECSLCLYQLPTDIQGVREVIVRQDVAPFTNEARLIIESTW